MTSKQMVQGLATSTAIAGFVLVGALVRPPGLHAAADGSQRRDDARHERRGDDDRGDGERVEAGLKMAPVNLTYHRRNRRLVGLGSYIVNGLSECNGCHSAGPATQFAPGGNPYFVLGAPPPRFNGTATTNPATYLGGGRVFAGVGGVDIVSRNLTPDHTGQPEGGASFGEFYDSMRLGIDHDHLHPVLAFPFDATKLQVMPWPAYRNWTDEDLEAVWEYLKAIPCVPGGPIPGHVC